MTDKTIVYLVWHTNPLNDDEKLIGVYSSDERARDVIQRYLDKPGFKDSPEGFEIAPYDLDKDEWTEGFVRVGSF